MVGEREERVEERVGDPEREGEKMGEQRRGEDRRVLLSSYELNQRHVKAARIRHTHVAVRIIYSG